VTEKVFVTSSQQEKDEKSPLSGYCCRYSLKPGKDVMPCVRQRKTFHLHNKT
jgi:hypothetical protein